MLPKWKSGPLLLDFQIQFTIYLFTDLLGHPTLPTALALDQQEWRLVCDHCKPRISDWN